MTSEEDIHGQQLLLKAHRQTLEILLRQRALHTTAFVPPSIEHGIREAREQIHIIKQTLRNWEISVADHPSDEDESTARPKTLAASIFARSPNEAPIVFPPENIRILVDHWLERTESLHPYRDDPRVLVILEKDNFVDQCCLYIETRGVTLYATHVLTILKSRKLHYDNLRKPENAKAVILVRAINVVPLADQITIYSLWVNSLLSAVSQRFAISIVPFTDEFEHVAKYDLWDKLDDISTVIHS